MQMAPDRGQGVRAYSIRKFEGFYMLKLRMAVFVTAFLIFQQPLHAGNILVDGDEPRKSITLTIENTKVEDVLKDFSQRFGIKVRGVENAKKGEPLSATMSGSLEDILGRLLRNWNHMIVRSRDNHSGIAKVTILNSTYGSASATIDKKRNLTQNPRRRYSSTRVDEDY